MPAKDNVKMNKRSPVVVVLGHVDHGKTSLLDYIRQSRVASREAGGITQSVGAYEIVHNGEKITFIDTPGHEAFSAMRSRGAQIADIAVVVISADEGPKPQTDESFKILEETKTPHIVALTKSDSLRADIEKVKNDLMNKGVFLEGYGGNISWQAVSSKTGEGISELLDLILLLADVSDLSYDEEAPARGFILESRKDNKRGILTSLILKDGVLKQGQEIATPSVTGKIRMLEDFAGKTVKELTPSAPAIVVGFENMPSAGEEFVAASMNIAEITPKVSIKKAIEEKPGEKAISVILKADVSGSLEVLRDILGTKVRVIDASSGDITDGDVKNAVSNKAFIVSFRSKFGGKPVEVFAKNQNVKIFSSDIIYDLVKSIDEYIEKNSEVELSGLMEIMATFGKKDDKQVIGGKIVEGSIKIGKKFDIKRKGISLGEGKIINLQSGRVDIKEVEAGMECGMLVDSLATIKEGDELSQAATK